MKDSVHEKLEINGPSGVRFDISFAGNPLPCGMTTSRELAMSRSENLCSRESLKALSWLLRFL
jgi:hypothetical protein